MPSFDLELHSGEQRLGPYRILRPISAGGMARVYEGRLDSLAGVSTRVAVKVIHPDYAADPAFRELFVAEARISARLEHPNLVRVQQFNEEGGLLYLVMEFIEGFTLRKLISHTRRTGVPVPTPVIAEIGRQICDGLEYAHALTDDHGAPLHLVHRDIKPSNLMVNRQGAVKVLDFGISSVGPDSVHETGVKGTWGYMALEQAYGHTVGPAADMFGLAAVLYELAVAEPLFPERDNEVIREALMNDAASRRAAERVKGPLAGVLVRALQRDPAARYEQSVAKFRQALSTLVGSPLAAHEALVALADELRSGDAGAPAPAPERARSTSTINPERLRAASAQHATRGGLPLYTGDAHGPRAPRATPPPRPRSSGGLWALGVVAAGIGVAAILGFAAYELARGPAPRPAGPDLSALAEPGPPTPVAPPPPTAPRAAQRPDAPASVPARVAPRAASPGAAPAPSSAPAATPVARPEASTAPTALPAPAPAAAPATRAAAAPPASTGFLSLGSEPAADILIDGSYVKRTPMMRRELSVGAHTIKLVPPSGEPKTFKVTVVGGEERTKIWNFEANAWVDE